MNIWEIFVAVILGLVEGLTEFAPVSSTGHMIIVDDLWLKSTEIFGSEVAHAFKVVIQLGSILAVVVLGAVHGFAWLKKNEGHFCCGRGKAEFASNYRRVATCDRIRFIVRGLYR